ncbi:MAG: HlyD family efflux transporter periplasmic adaptor subunit [Phycisphaerales bacterium]|nr:HlyD family efflux transporter periplasmic adaptor subunit [Phycisphaerales bacterium]
MNTPSKSIKTNSSAEQAWRDDAPEKPSDLLSGISAIERESGSAREKAEAFLNVVVEHFGSLSGSLTIGLSGDEVDLVCNGVPDGVEKWRSYLRSTALEARSRASSIARLFGPDGNPQHAVIACPIDNAGRDPFGAVAILVRCDSTAHAERVQLNLRAACLQIAAILTRKSSNKSTVEMSDIARVYSRAGQFSSIQQFAFTITNSARQRFNCDQATMGIVRDDKVRVVCISGLDTVKLRSPGVQKIEQAMGECVDAGCPVVAQSRDRWEDAPSAEEGMLHQAWRASVNGASVLSIPIDTGDGPLAVVSFRRSADEPFDTDDIESAKKLLVPLAGAIPLVTKATESLPKHAIKTTRAAVNWFAGPNTLRRKLMLIALLSMIAWVAMGTRMYRVSVPAVIVAKHEQLVSAPFDGQIASVHVRNGDRVQADQQLVTMDTTSIELELMNLESELGNARLRLSGEIAQGNPAGASIAQGEIRSMQARITLLKNQIVDSVIKAPYAGVVMAPELSELTGRIVSTGQPIASVAQDGSMSIELRVPPDRVTDLIEGNRLRFASHARPELPGFSTLGELTPASVQREGQSVFIAEATLPEDQSWLRPGMSGVAQVEVGERTNWWLAVHRIVDAARLRFWFD